MKLSFYFDKHGYKGKEEKPFPLMCRVRVPFGKMEGKYQYKDIVFSTGCNLTESQWDKEKQKAKGKTDKDHELNKVVRKIKDDFENINLSAKVNQTDLYTQLLNHFLPQTKAEEKAVLLPIAWMRHFLERKKNDVSPNTIKAYKPVIDKLEHYQQQKGFILQWDSFDYGFFDCLPQYLIEQYNLTNNTIEKTISTIKTLLNYAEKEGIVLNPYYKKVSVTKYNTQSTDIALTKSELSSLFHFDLSANPKLEKTRDLFCFMCFTGLRVSDLKQFKREHIKENIESENEKDKYYLELIMEKTKHKIIVPLISYSMMILEKYNFSFNVKSEQKLNDEIKVIAEMTGAFNTNIEKVMMQGVKKLTETLPKFKMIKNHTARRTFATICATELGIPLYDIMQLLGHSDIQTTQNYLKENEQTILRNASQHLGRFTL